MDSSFVAAAPRSRQHGGALGVTLHVVLLLLVLGQIVYLASRYRLRADVTSDRLWSLTDSTRSLLGNLQERLVVEAYFSEKDKLPVNVRNSRAVLDNFLDEMVQLGKGKVVVQRFDPNADKAIADKCSRVGVQPADLRSSTSSSTSLDRHWQGVRFVYGGGKQKVIPQIAPSSSFQAEALITPAVKEVITTHKRKFGYMEWPVAQSGQAPGGIGWNALRTLDAVAKRYEFQNYKDEDAALLPTDLDTLFLFRPKDLSDRQKYVFDQFLLNGGTLVVFADAAEYTIGPRRAFTKAPMSIDAPGSTKTFVDQLSSYGIEWRTKVVADMALEAQAPRDRFGAPFEYFAAPELNMFGQQQLAWKPYPYFFHAVAGDWSKAADQLATDPQTRQVDGERADRYRKLFGSGMPTDDFLFSSFRQIGRGPGFYWPTWVGLRQKNGADDLPNGVTGRVLLRSSPLPLVEDAPPTVDPIGSGDPRARKEQYERFTAALRERVAAQTPQQAPLMVDVRGTFASCFAGTERPKRPSQIKEEEAKKAEAAAAGEVVPGEAPAEKPPQAEVMGPEPAKSDDAAAAAPTEAAMLTLANKPGRIVMIGDSDFVRDDLVRGEYQQAGGPYSSPLGALFFTQLLDWLAEDQDLIALQSRVPVDRTLKFVDEQSTAGDVRGTEQALLRKTRLVRVLNWLLPPVLLALFGLCVFAVRRAHKRRFLSSLS